MTVRVAVRQAGRQISYWAHPVRAWLQPRHFHAYCVSAPRSGTHSIAGLFANYRAAHEPDSDLVADAVRRRAEGKIDDRPFRLWLEWRDRALWLEMESHNLLNNIAGVLAATFPDARFVLVIRDCYSWLESYVNYHLAPLPPWEDRLAKTVRDWQLGANRFTHNAADRALTNRGLYPLDAYLAFWAACNERVLTQVPADRLLVLRLHELDARRADLGGFLGVPADTLDVSRSHVDRREHTVEVLREIDRGYLEERVQHYCGALMATYFPGLGVPEYALPTGAPTRGSMPQGGDA